ncbi:serine/threonine-protein kinase [Rosistilla oblonga]|uniref:Serine/threonine-protein kinase PknD n=1 Tax=Rosistilla oblonga TaxID=2527990 RepID=A0A518IM88_9BACT|nr:serine/threonine-protein kinase [Rosistilla oblonga]QDV54194.1 Serine/threonine-protein kinase PknD [Rosistilla oblonga]
MSDLMKTTDSSATDEDSAAMPELDQTLAHDGASQSAGSDADTAKGTKQSRDLAFAVALLKMGHANVRTLAGAAKSWTTHGNLSLADHLFEQKTISADQRTAVQRRSQQMLTSIAKLDRDARSNGANGNKDPMTSSDREQHWLAQLDPNGKVAKLLGIADTSVLSQDEVQDRQVGSRYTLLRKLGQGGLGIVWLARDQNLQRYVAVKEISREVAPGDVALDHFRREAEITGRLEHPGIVPVYQYGEDEATGKSFYVMRFLGKRTMQDAIAEYHERREAGNDDPMMLHRLLSALINVCNSVGHAHSRKVIHRDLKPENVALDEFGQVTLLDWGLAMINDASGMYEVNGRTEPGDLHSVGSTQVGRVLGTPLYMAPEQASGRLDEIDELTDVFALGGMLYAILTGVAPHQSAIEDAETGSSRSDIMSQIVAGEVVPPIKLVPSVPPELNAICVKALSSKRYLRYESAKALEVEIERFIAGTPVHAYKPPTKQRLKRWMADHPTATQSLLLATSLLLIGGAAIAYTARQGRSALQQARYASAQEFTRELEVNLNFETEGMVRNLHFVSELPLMEAVVASHQGGTAIAPQSDGSMAEVGPVELLNRQAHLFGGLLKANPAYLVAYSCIEEEGGGIRELIRSERSGVGRRVFRVPERDLLAREASERDEEGTQVIHSLRPDDVVLITNDQISENVPVNNRSPLVVSGVQATFDSNGLLFGLNIIELDLRSRLEELFTAVAPERVTIYVTDVAGSIVLQFHNGRVQAVDNASITDEFTQLKTFFAEGSTDREFGDGTKVFARRVQLGGSPKAQLGIIAHIQQK